MFITFEGIDGSGKSTQLELLYKYLSDRDYQVIVLREPGGTDFSESLRKILLHSKNELNSVSELFLFEAARADLVERVIKPKLNEGKIVLCDRFYDSTTAYQGFGRGLPHKEIELLNKFATAGLQPDFTFYLDIHLEVSFERTQTRVKDRIENSNDEFFARIINGFRELAKKEPERIFLVNANNNIEDTFNIILNILKNRLL